MATFFQIIFDIYNNYDIFKLKNTPFLLILRGELRKEGIRQILNNDSGIT